MPEVMRGLATMSSTVADITAITVALGPGPYNGLRVAVAAAKGLATGTGAAVCGINTLEAEAARCPDTVAEVRPVLHAGKSGFATARYSHNGAAWLKEVGERVVDETTLIELAKQGPPLCGEIDDGLAERLRAAGREMCTPVITRVDALARLGYECLKGDRQTTLATLQPVYARPPHITQPRQRRT